jgi:hypothetical protein
VIVTGLIAFQQGVKGEVDWKIINNAFVDKYLFFKDIYNMSLDVKNKDELVDKIREYIHSTKSEDIGEYKLRGVKQ